METNYWIPLVVDVRAIHRFEFYWESLDHGFYILNLSWLHLYVVIKLFIIYLFLVPEKKNHSINFFSF